MTIITRQNVLSGLKVKEAMRKEVVCLDCQKTLEEAIHRMVKYKVNALLILDSKNTPIGVLSKTDLVSMYYAGLDLATCIDDVMVVSVLSCHPESSLESSLDFMLEHAIKRLYVLNPANDLVVGVLSYTDVVGLLYRFCFHCRQNIFATSTSPASRSFERLHVKEVMKSSVLDHKTDEPIYLALETLLTHHFGAVLIRTPEGQPLGVLSKSDIILAYKHGISPESKIQTVMNQPLLSCLQEDDLVQALQIMVYADIKRLFVFDTSFHDIIGVISLTDIARTKSGSCKACITSRIHHACPQL